MFRARPHCFKCGRANAGKHRAKNRAKEFVREIAPDYTMLGDYVKTSKPTLIQHNKCGFKWEISPNNLLNALRKNKTRCPKCNHMIRITPEIFYDAVAKNNTHTFKSIKFNGSKKLADIVCANGHHSKANARNLMYNDVYCVQCFNETKAGTYHKYTIEGIQAKLDKKFGKDVIQIVGEYTNTNTPTTFRHNCAKCNYYTWEARPSLVMGKGKGKGCPKCLHNIKKYTTEDFKKRVYKAVGDEYLVLGEYKNMSTKIRMQHNIPTCQHIYYVLPSDFISKRGSRCPVHCESHGEQWVRYYLQDSPYHFKSQVPFDGLVDRNPLLYDFYIKELNTLIEYDGIQHVVGTKGMRWWTEEDRQRYYKHDRMKNKYAKDHNIRLIRIPHTVEGQEAVNEFLDKTL